MRKLLFVLSLLVAPAAWPCTSGSTCQFNLLNSTAVGSTSYWSLQDGGSVSNAATTASVAQSDSAGGPPAFSDVDANVAVTAGIDVFNNAVPAATNSGGDTSDGFRSQNALTGSIAAGTWNWKVQVNISNACHIHVCMALWKAASANQNGSGSATQIGTTQCSSSVNVTGSHTGSFVTGGATTFSGEYLYFVGYWSVDDIGVNALCGTAQVGSAQSNVTTPVFTAAGIFSLPMTGVGQ